MNRMKGFPSYPGSKFVYGILGLLSIMEAIGIIAQAFFLARVITFLFQGAAITDVVSDMALFLVSFFFRYACSLIGRVITERFALRTGEYLRKKLIDAYFNNGTRFVSSFGTGRLVLLAIEGMDQLKEYIELAIPRMIRTMIVPIFIVVYIFTIDKISAGILVVTVPIVIIFMILLGLAAQKMADRQYETYRVLSNHFIDSLKGLETLKYLGQSKKHESKIGKVSSEYRKATNRTLRVAFLSSFALDFFTSLSIAFVAVTLGFRLIDGITDLLPALTILILAPEYFLPIRQVGKDYHATLDGQIAMTEIDQIIDLQEPPIKRTKDEQITWTEESSIQLEQISVTVEDKSILKNISFSWSGPGLIGIVGASGAGKSTLIHLLAGFIKPNNGTIRLDQHTTNTLQREDWLEKIAYIPQHPYIFPTSLANNIRFYEPNASDEEVHMIVQQIGLGPFVNQLPDGINEKIGEGGRMLSGGQEQRVAMARALLSKRPIILLDEPTAHLDIETEYEIKQLMLELFKQKLVFFATHRMHWMSQMDTLVMIDKGKIVEQGTHDTLMANQGRYFQLVKGTKGRR